MKKSRRENEKKSKILIENEMGEFSRHRDEQKRKSSHSRFISVYVFGICGKPKWSTQTEQR